MKKTNTLLIILLLFNFLATAQGYFQQEVNYKINVKLNDVEHSLSAYIEIEYINNSPNTLDFIYFHLWPNAYKNGETALAKQKLENSTYRWFEKEYNTGYIDSLDFKIDGKKANWEYDNHHIDICKLELNEPLKPGERIIITTPFYVKIPSCFISRFGHGGQSYQITQWYPKPAVYDKYGWHQMPYLNMGEFYSEFGSYDVSITLPKNYVVGATGDLQNEEELKWLNELAKKTEQIKNFDKTDRSFPKSDSVLKTIRYKQKNIHDFAWFADKRFHVLKGERKMPHTGKKVTCWAMFLNKEADLWQHSIEYIGDALYYYSQWYGDYPYNNCTAVHSSISAGSGMEYPNITVIGDSRKDMALEMVIMHEVGHNWFYGMLGFNEREYPWLDEGINSFSEARYFKEKYKDEDRLYKLALTEKQAKLLNVEDLPYKVYHLYSYLLPARFNIDQPATLHSVDYTMTNYGSMVYSKSSCVFDHLLAYLGEDQFNKIMQDFFKKWQYKHPYPEDVREAFEKGSGKNLSWLFDDLLSTTKKLDYKITGLHHNQLTVKNKGMINAPFPVTAIKDNKEVFTQWYEGFSDKKTFTLPENKDYDYIRIDPDYRMPEMYTQNNYIRKKGILRKVEPIHVQLAGIIENTEKTNLYLFPAMGWNQYNKYMLGVMFYNSFIPRNKFEYQFIPMYGFGNHNVAGYGNMEYHILPYNSTFREVTLGISAKRYAYSNASDDFYQKFRGEVNFHLRKTNPKSKIKNNIILSGTLADDVTDIILNQNPDLQTFINLDYIHQNKTFNPYSFKASAQYNKDFVKTNAEFNYTWNYKYNKSVGLRLFAGGFLYTSDKYNPIYNYGVSGISGLSDYTYDNLFLGRFEDPEGTNLWGKQYVPNDGGFTIYAPQFTTSNWVIALNTSAAIPYLPTILNFHVYGNIAAFGTPEVYGNYKNTDRIAWEFGIQYRIGKDIFVISLPLLMSKQLMDYSDDVYGKVYERIRFSLDISKLNIFNAFENFMP